MDGINEVGVLVEILGVSVPLVLPKEGNKKKKNKRNDDYIPFEFTFVAPPKEEKRFEEDRLEIKTFGNVISNSEPEPLKPLEFDLGKVKISDDEWSAILDKAYNSNLNDVNYTDYYHDHLNDNVDDDIADFILPNDDEEEIDVKIHITNVEDPLMDIVTISGVNDFLVSFYVEDMDADIPLVPVIAHEHDDYNGHWNWLSYILPSTALIATDSPDSYLIFNDALMKANTRFIWMGRLNERKSILGLYHIDEALSEAGEDFIYKINQLFTKYIRNTPLTPVPLIFNTENVFMSDEEALSLLQTLMTTMTEDNEEDDEEMTEDIIYEFYEDDSENDEEDLEDDEEDEEIEEDLEDSDEEVDEDDTGGFVDDSDSGIASGEIADDFAALSKALADKASQSLEDLITYDDEEIDDEDEVEENEEEAEDVDIETFQPIRSDYTRSRY